MATFIQETPSHPREDLRQRHPRATAANEFRAALDALSITQHRVAQLFRVAPRTVRHWQHGDRRVPHGVVILCRLLIAETITVTQIEQASVRIPARTNGRAKAALRAPLRDEPAPEQSALTRAEAAAFGTTGDKVLALTADACRWPCGDPGGPDFHFCGAPVTAQPYCERHRGMAYLPSIARRPAAPFRLKILTARKLTAAEAKADGAGARKDIGVKQTPQMQSSDEAPGAGAS
jgi:hypothetical protein